MWNIVQIHDNRPAWAGTLLCVGQWVSTHMAWVVAVDGGGDVFFQYLLWANKQECYWMNPIIIYKLSPATPCARPQYTFIKYNIDSHVYSQSSFLFPQTWSKETVSMTYGLHMYLMFLTFSLDLQPSIFYMLYYIEYYFWYFFKVLTIWKLYKLYFLESWPKSLLLYIFNDYEVKYSLITVHCIHYSIKLIKHVLYIISHM